MPPIVPFLKYFIEESLKRLSIAELMDADINKLCHSIVNFPLDIKPGIQNEAQAAFEYRNPKILYVFPFCF